MADDYLNLPALNASLDQLAATTQRRNNPAGYMQERMMQQILMHQGVLTEDQELGVYVVGGNASSFHLRQIRYSNPDILIFVGKDAESNTVQLMQHHSQMSVMLVGLPKLEEKAFRIGFVPSSQE